MKSRRRAIYGIFLIVFMYVMPYGVSGFLRLAWSRLLRATAGTRPE